MYNLTKNNQNRNKKQKKYLSANKNSLLEEIYLPSLTLGRTSKKDNLTFYFLLNIFSSYYFFFNYNVIIVIIKIYYFIYFL
jgi:hypothetical protein